MQTEQEDSLSVRADETVTTSRLKDTDKDASEVVEVGLHVEAVEEMLQDKTNRYRYQYQSPLGPRPTALSKTGRTLYRLMTLTTQASRWKIFLFPTRIRAS